MIRTATTDGRGYFGIGVFHSKSTVNIGTLMRSAYCFGARYVFTIGRRYARQSSDTTNSTAHVPCFHYETFDQFTEFMPLGCRIIGVELADGARNLDAYVHPERAVYLLGAEDHGIPADYLRRCHDVIVIPGACRCLNVASAGSIVMYDRVSAKRSRFVEPMRQRSRKLDAARA